MSVKMAPILVNKGNAASILLVHSDVKLLQVPIFVNAIIRYSSCYELYLNV